MAKVDAARVAALKALFEDGDRLTEENLADLITAVAEAAEDHEHKVTGGSGSGYGDAGPVQNLRSNVEAELPASPAVGDVFIATDTATFYVCFSFGEWTQVYP